MNYNIHYKTVLRPDEPPGTVFGNIKIFYQKPEDTTTTKLSTGTTSVPYGTILTFEGEQARITYNGELTSWKDLQIIVSNNVEIESKWAKVAGGWVYSWTVIDMIPMFNLEFVKEWTIPEGKVTEVSINGKVVWSSGPKVLTLNAISTSPFSIRNNTQGYSISAGKNYEVKEGDIIHISYSNANYHSSADCGHATVKVNGTTVSSAGGYHGTDSDGYDIYRLSLSYDYKVTSSFTIKTEVKGSGSSADRYLYITTK